MRTLITIIIATIVFTACQKQDKQPVPTTITAKQASVGSLVLFTDITFPTNPQNPYDSIGILHNILLDTVWSYVQRTGDTSSAGKTSQIIRYFRERSGLDVSRGMGRTSALIQAEYIKGKEADCLSKYLRSEALHYVLKALDLLKAIKEERDCKLFKPAVLALEREIIGDPNLTETERMKILMVTSIMRYSFYYWEKAVLHDTQGGARKNTFGFLKDIVRFLAYSQMDAIGAIYGLFPFEGMDQLCADAAGESSMAVWYLDQWL